MPTRIQPSHKEHF